MPDPVDRIGGLPVVRQLPDLLRAQGEARLRGAAGSGGALIAAWLAESVRTPALIVCPGQDEAEEVAEDLNLFRPGSACCFPALEVLPGDEEEPNEAILRARLAVLRFLSFGEAEEAADDFLDVLYPPPSPDTRVVVAPIYALMQPTRTVEGLRRGARNVSVGEPTGPGEIVTWLVDRDYVSVPQVRVPGQYCLRGGILDVYSHGALEPVRVEFFGDEVDSIRKFDPDTQRSTGRVERCQLTVSEHPGAEEEQDRGSLLDYFEPDCAAAIVQPERTWHRCEVMHGQAPSHHGLRGLDELRPELDGHPCLILGLDEEADAPRAPVRPKDSYGPDLDSMLAELARICGDYRDVILYCIRPAEADRFRALLRDREFEQRDEIELEIGRLNHGVFCEEAGLALIPHHRLFGRYRQRRVVRHAREGRPIESAEKLQPGDLVVHVNHGIGRFVGTRFIERAGRRREHLQIEFAEGTHVHVPCDRIEMVHRYIGVGGREPDLSRIRSSAWTRARERTEEAVEDLAAELLELQALRETQRGIAFPEDGDWQRQFEAEFPYEETEDQLSAIEDVKRDMQTPRPMDRLLCGDVGYGKTEVAMRAAFKAVMGGRQVAMLVPTTVLAQQHYRTFSERMADYPVRVEMLSRFRTGAETREVLEGMSDGTVDIIIGTHRLVQDDVAFKDLGLLIIDEEQRFGVEHKEKLKQARATIDVLTMTATPIPRTLHMSLMGLREISALQTPPRDRQAIQTQVREFDPDLLRHAILRELNREGQVFVIHNRVQTIRKFAERVQGLVPEATVAVAHGQMRERELAENMDLFTEGAVDVLVSTTIIENGLDIPNANTIILHRADLLGLAEMHQLRGRVGRYVHKAYAYFFKPRSRPVTPEAEKRLETIRRYSDLGAGFDIALRDLEIRGAGNILGPDQSGHIAAVGYSLYCRLLTRAAARLKGKEVKEPPSATLNIGLDAFLSDDYVPAPRQRMEMYRRVHRCTDLNAVDEVREAMRDRFGDPPAEAENLLLEAELRILAEEAGVDSVQLRDGRLHLGVKDAEALKRRFGGEEDAPRLIGDDLAVVDDGFPVADPRALALYLRQMFAREREAA